ncbi:MAG TPA: 50S ribosomal protein L17 [Bacteroidales bacterium]|jgi:large subunit ribosomal protein L17|nr:50S ribosomal protein L17 [Bacteroidales bacterium]
MRHAKRINQLGRTSSHRAAMLSNMAASLIMHKRITTTLAKAKELRKYLEPLITKSKNDTTHSRRVVFSYLQDKYAVTELFREISQKVADRPGGYLRILKTGFRQGDNAEMCIIELVDYNEDYTTQKETKKTTRTRRSRKSTATAKPTVEETQTETVEQIAEEPTAETVEPIVEEEPTAEEPTAETVEPIVEEPQAVEKETAPAAETAVEEPKQTEEPTDTAEETSETTPEK